MQRRVRWNPAGGFVAVSQFGRKHHFDHAALADILHALGPSGHDVGQRERDRLGAIVGLVKRSSVVQPTAVVHGDFRRRGRFGSVAASQNSILQSRLGLRKFGRRVRVDDRRSDAAGRSATDRRHDQHQRRHSRPPTVHRQRDSEKSAGNHRRFAAGERNLSRVLCRLIDRSATPAIDRRRRRVPQRPACIAANRPAGS